MSSGASDKIHILTVDYRGFGYSSGNPTEGGLIIDGISLVNWLLNVAGIPSGRIVILGQSLGTAVATAVAEHFVSESGIEFAGIILVAGFSDIPTLMLTYSIGGIIPILSPLRPYPILQSFFGTHIQETWHTASRITKLVRNSNTLYLTLIHSKNDYEIPYTHSDVLFYTAANATSEAGMTSKQIDSVKTRQYQGEGGWVIGWTAPGPGDFDTKEIRYEIINHGGKALSNLFANVITADSYPRA